VSVSESLSQICPAFSRAGFSLVLHIRGNDRETDPSCTVHPGGNCSDYLLSSFAGPCRKDWFRFCVLVGGQRHGGPVIHQCGMDILKPTLRSESIDPFYRDVCADLHLAAARGQFPAGGSNCQFRRGGGSHVLYSQDRLV